MNREGLRGRKSIGGHNLGHGFGVENRKKEEGGGGGGAENMVVKTRRKKREGRGIYITTAYAPE
jgi:hypothetical protein